MRILPPLLVFLLIPWAGSAQKTDLPLPTLFDDLYRHDTLLEIVLQCDWDSLLAMRKTDAEFEGRLSYPRRDGTIAIWDVGISTRGKFRRRICSFPPVKLEFSKKDLRKAGFEPFDDLKLVTHCMNDPVAGDRVIREYLAYQLYQLLTPYAFRAQLVKIRYAGEGLSNPAPEHFGILLEEDRMLAHRLNLDRIDTLNLPEEALPDELADVHALFQYLMGNADWSLMASRNIEILRDSSSGQFYLVPFDFDFSGFVHAYYAIPNPDYKLNDIRDRVYLGNSPPSEKARQRLLAQQKAFFKTIRQASLLSMGARAECLQYLRSGFRDIKKNRLTFPQAAKK